MHSEVINMTTQAKANFLDFSSQDVREPPKDIVVIEDDGEALQCMAEALSAEGYNPNCFDNPQDAILFLESAPKQFAVVTDLRLPRFDGLEFVDRLRKIAGHNVTPVVLVSGNAGRADLKRAIGHGIVDDVRDGVIEVVAEAPQGVECAGGIGDADDLLHGFGLR